MKLVLYSGGQYKSNHLLHEAISHLTRKSGPNRSFTYVAFTDDGGRVFFNRAVRRYSRFGFKRFHYLPADVPVDKKHLKQCLKSDVLYLAGGNTFYYLHHLRKNGLLPEIQKFAKRGGVVAGLSAGAIIMSANIGLAGYPAFDRDDNKVGLKNLKSLGLVDFEVFPHDSGSRRLRKALETYSKRTGKPIYGIEDGGGIVIEGNKKTFFGSITLYHQGSHLDII